MSERVDARDTGLHTCSVSHSLCKENWTGVRVSRVGVQNHHLTPRLEFLKDPVYQSVGWRCVSHYTAVIGIK